MSSGYWQTERQRERFSNGKTATRKARDYVDTWCCRCYGFDIPDELPTGLEKSGRAPSYKKIAMAILKNDLNFHSLGFARDETELSKNLLRQKKDQDSNQSSLF
jgi:predicted phosphoadenosine phosphosulfate sulfurtransferase